MNDIKLPPMPKPHTPPVFATAANTQSVKAGYELGGYEKTPPLFDEHQLEAYAREAVRLNVAVPDGWVLIAADAYEAGYGKGLQAAQTGKEIENPWGDEPGREAWSIGYALAKERAPAAPQPAQPLTDEQWLQLLLREADNETLLIAAIPGESIQTQGRWVLLNAGKKLKSLIERHYGITKKEQP